VDGGSQGVARRYVGCLGRRRLEAEAGHSIMFELVQPNRGFRDHASSKQRAFHPAATRPKTNYLSGDRADHSSSPLDLAVRFMGLSENASEAKKDHAELSARVKAGQPIYGETDLTDYVQSVAARNSTWSQLKLSVMPW
jgi:hypothetical protein